MTAAAKDRFSGSHLRHLSSEVTVGLDIGVIWMNISPEVENLEMNEEAESHARDQSMSLFGSTELLIERLCLLRHHIF